MTKENIKLTVAYYPKTLNDKAAFNYVYTILRKYSVDHIEAEYSADMVDFSFTIESNEINDLIKEAMDKQIEVINISTEKRMFTSMLKNIIYQLEQYKKGIIIDNEKTYDFVISGLAQAGLTESRRTKKALLNLSYFLKDYTRTSELSIHDNEVTAEFVATADQVYYLWLMTSEEHNPYDYKPTELNYYSWLKAYQYKIHRELEKTWKAIRSERTNPSEIEMTIHVPNQMLNDDTLETPTNKLLTIFFNGYPAVAESHMFNTIITGKVHLEYMQQRFDEIVKWVHSNEELYSNNPTIEGLVSQMLSVLRNTLLDYSKDFAPAPDVTFVFGGKTLDTSDDAAAVGAYIMLKGESSQEAPEEVNAPMTVEEYDMVHHPKHYQLPSGKETKEVLYDLLGSEGYQFWCVGNTVKYVSRYKDKENPIQDLKKAQQNIQMIIDVLKKEED